MTVKFGNPGNGKNIEDKAPRGLKRLGRLSGRRARRAAAAALLPAIAAVALGACGSSGSSSGGESSGGGAPAPAVSSQADNPGNASTSGHNISTYAVWGTDDCLEYAAVDTDTSETLAVEATNLCRQLTQTVPNGSAVSAGTYYYLFDRGNPANWHEVVGAGTGGYYYWAYHTDDEWYRQADGGPLQMLVNNDGQLEYLDAATFLQQNPHALSVVQRVGEDLAAQAVASAAVGVTIQRNPESKPDTDQEYPAAQSGITNQNQQAQQAAESYGNAQQGGITPDQELARVAGAHARMIQIEYAPDCENSDNVEDGCGGQNAYNDVGGYDNN
jgi:hypothetical protein